MTRLHRPKRSQLSTWRLHRELIRDKNESDYCHCHACTRVMMYNVLMKGNGKNNIENRLENAHL